MRFMGNIEHAMSVLKSSKAAPPAGTPQRNVVTNVSIPNSSFAQSAVAYTPMRRSGQTAGNTIYTQPSFFSPLHTPQNWQIPSKRREVMQWLALRPMMLTTSDFTMKDVEELSFEAKEAVEDTVTGGIMYEVDCEPILASSGTYRKPCRMSIRDVVDKDAIEFKAVGYWRTMNVTADHKQIWIDGKTHRKKVKLLANASYRASKGIPVGGDKPRHEAWDAKVVKKGLASEISMDDYLLYPVPNTGKQSIDKDAAWLVGNCIADGCVTPHGVRFTTSKDEPHVLDIIGCLERTFTSKLRSDDPPVISSKQHGLGNGWRVSISTQSSSSFFSEYITGKLTKKKFTVKAFDLDRESRLNILGGYFDGDGCFADQKLIATNFSMDMADQIYAMLLSVGIRCSLTRHPVAEGSYPTSSEWFYRIYIPASDVPMLQPYMKGEKIPSDLVAKPERNLRFFYEEDGVSYLVQPIEYIKQYKYTGQGYDLEIRPEHAYVLNGYVTSNCRYYYENEPKVAAAIDFYSNFAINGFETSCEQHAVKKFFDNVNAKLNLDSWTKMMSKEYYLIGDVFPFLEIDCDKCKGSGISREGKLCRHPGGSFRRLVVLNPDWIDVQTNIMVDDPVITMIPDDELKKIVWRKQPKAIYDRLPANIRQLILGNRPIPLSNECVSHLRHNPYPYGTYGVSLLRRLFKTLAYKDKLMSAQWIIAERMILPVRVIKLGDSERPAGPADIADVQAQLANVVNDPNLTLVTHHAFNYDWIGCLSTDYENSFVLCQDGIKHFRDLGEEDLIATWNADNGKVEYQKFIRKVEFDYNKSNSWGYAYRIGNGKWSFLTTPNHRHYLDDGTVKLSEDLVVGDKLLRQDKWSWEGSIPSRLPYLEREEFKDFSLEDFCKFAGYYVAEGHVKREGNKNLSEDKKIQCFGMSQNFSSTCFEDMRALCKKASPTMWETIDERGSGNNYQFMIGNADLSRWMAKEFGDGSYDKKFPSWMMELPASYLRIIWDAMYAGDGTAKRNRYSTASDQLRDQVCNMLVKMGRSPRIDVERGTTPKGKEYKTNRISWGDVCINETFTLTSIEKIPFEGRMWCLEMQNHNFFVKAGKQIILTGNTSGKVLQLSNEYELIDKEILQGLMINDALLSGSMGSYQSAAIGAEAMIQRMESWRLELGRWIEDKIYKPIAQMRGFIDETASKEIGEPVWIYPRVQWNELNIRDDSQQKQLINALFDKGLVSGQTLLEKYNMDYDHEIERLRFESASQKLAGMSGAGGAGGMIGGGAAGGAAGGGMEGLFGGGGAGGMPPGPEAGGAPPGGAPPGGAPPGGAAPAGGAAASVGGTSGKILSKGRKPMQSSVPDEADAQPVTVRLTSLEAMMHKEISAMRLPFSIGVQQTIGPYVADFCVPALRLDIEVDGAYWHNQPETKAHDNIRDKELSQAGWTVLRFGEADLKERMPDVRKTIVAYVQKNWRRAIEDNKRRTNALEESLRLTKFAGEDSVEVEAHIAPAEVEESGNSNQGEGNPVV